MDELAVRLREQLESAGSAQLIVTGYSMVPMLHNRRDTVTLVPFRGCAKPGDVIFFQRGDGQLVLHRIVGMREQCYICSGDHESKPETVLPEQVLAVVESFTRGGKAYCVKDPSCRIYSFLVTRSFPIRRPFLALRKAAGRIRSSLRRQ